MLRKEVNRTSLFDVYVREAPGDPGEGDNVSVTVAPRANRGTDYTEDPNDITVAPRSNRGSNYDSDDTATDDMDATPEETPEDVGDTTQDVDTEPTDYGAEDDTDAPEEGGEETVEEEPAEDDATGAEETGEEEEGPDLGDEGTDYTDDAGTDDTGEDTGEDDTGEDTGEGDTEDAGASEDDLVEQEKKFNFYKIYMNVYSALENMIETLKSCVKNNPVENAVIEQVTSNLSDMKSILYDYMIAKYSTESYAAILSYYETIIIGIKLQIEILKNNKISLKQ